MTKVQRFRVWLAKKLLRRTDYIAVPLDEVKQIDRMIGELQIYAADSGALNSPHRTHARKRVMQYTNGLRSSSFKLLGEHQ